jgi:DNA ligase D-like protein (predicted 3'-phosphoesterase)
MGADLPRFVVQRHQARTLHYDFRLESEGVLKSWAVPKGPSTDPSDKRLAVPVPDHSLSHGYYESDSVTIWDKGEYRPLGELPFADQLAAGHASFWLDGERLAGAWLLQRTDDGRWLLIKRRDEAPT